ncbi:MAG: hypothetical protein JWR05_3103 [Mucilaginibacter sp.]|nr:hypothetical protein [Mucilaginibacter sp.]
MTHLIFVYGTLLQPGNGLAQYLISNSTYLNAGYIKGTLYDIGEYPGLVINEKSGLVHGSIYEINDQTLKQIDDYEGYGIDQEEPNLYIRMMISVQTTEGIIEAWVYLYNLPVDGLQIINSGKYMEYIKQKKSPGL